MNVSRLFALCTLAVAGTFASVSIPSAALATTAAATATSSQDIAQRAQAESLRFVEFFNQQDVNQLRKIYRRQGILKLPGSAPVAGRDNIRDAWQGGFDAGLSTLALTNLTYTPLTSKIVLESGNYALEINTPNGTITQIGTFAVQWHVPFNPNRRPKIQFDTIDAD